MAGIYKNPKLPVYKLPKNLGKGSSTFKGGNSTTPKVKSPTSGVIKPFKHLSITKYTKIKTPKVTKITILKRAVKKAKNVFS